MEKLIREIIHVGNPYLALETGAIDPINMIQYLQGVKFIEIEHMIAFRAIYDKAPQYRRDLAVKFSCREAFKKLYAYLRKGASITEYRQEICLQDDSAFSADNSELLVSGLLPLLGLQLTNEFDLYMIVACRMLESDLVKESDFFQDYCVTNSLFDKIVIDNDEVTHFQNNVYGKEGNEVRERHLFYFQDILDRCAYLKENAPLYWWKIARDYYHKYLEEIDFSEHPTHRYEKTYLEIFDMPLSLLPEGNHFLVSTILNINFEKLNIYNKAYFLGYPIHLHMPSVKVIDEHYNALLEEIREDGMRAVERHCLEIYERNSIYLENISKNIFMTPRVNDKNCMLEEIKDYNTFDVTYYMTDNHIHTFTRDEFFSMITSEKNIYTNEHLPIGIREEMTSRLNISGAYNLIDCLPIYDLWEEISKVNPGTEPDDAEINYFNSLKPAPKKIHICDDCMSEIPLSTEGAWLTNTHVYDSVDDAYQEFLERMGRIILDDFNEILDDYDSYTTDPNTYSEDSEYYSEDSDYEPISLEEYDNPTESDRYSHLYLI